MNPKFWLLAIRPPYPHFPNFKCYNVVCSNQDTSNFNVLLYIATRHFSNFLIYKEVQNQSQVFCVYKLQRKLCTNTCRFHMLCNQFIKLGPEKSSFLELQTFLVWPILTSRLSQSWCKILLISAELRLISLQDKNLAVMIQFSMWSTCW